MNHMFLIRLVSVCLLVSVFPSSIYGQVSPEEHKKHHPGQAAPAAAEPTNKGSGMGGGMMSGKGGGMMEGGMGGMMEKMGAPKPKELYPKLMSLPNLSMEERIEIRQEAHQRMMVGADQLAHGLDELTAAAPTDNFNAMQSATAEMREGLAQFESGLAAHRAINEGKAPRNVALQWFKHEMNLLPPASAKPGFHFFGMTPFHTSVMAVLVVFSVTMIWMYYFKMRRAASLLHKLSIAEPATDTKSMPISSPVNPASETSSPNTVTSPAVSVTSNTASATPDCCHESSVECEDKPGATGRHDISQGLLNVAKRKLCRLRVAKIFQETADVKTFRLVACHGGALPFNYFPGQFLTVTMTTGEKPIRRSYTISSSPTQGYYCEITVKREDMGIGSKFLHDIVKMGDLLEVQAPSGKFIFTGQEADDIVLISGGVGITPMMSITRALTDMGWPGEIYFIVACRDSEHFIFESELINIQEHHSNLHLHVAMSRIQNDINGYHAGRFTRELLSKWVPDIASMWIHLCGAPPMMDTTKQFLSELSVPRNKIHTENFGSQQKPRVISTEREKADSDAAITTTSMMNFATSGKSTQLLPDETILEASERVDVNIDYSCRTGMCGVCTVKLLSGQVAMEVEDGLEADDQAAGLILACQAKSTGDVTVEA